MPARNSTVLPTDKVSCDCPEGDGGICTLTRPPMVIAGGSLRELDQQAGVLELDLAEGSVEVLPGRGSEALAQYLAEGDTRGRGTAVVMTCSCGHVLISMRARKVASRIKQDSQRDEMGEGP